MNIWCIFLPSFLDLLFHICRFTQSSTICNPENPKPRFKQCSLRSYSADLSFNPLPIDDPINNHLIKGSEIVGHSNGLLCILNKPASLFLWNPSTRISFQLPKLDCDKIIKLGFGWNEQGDAYKVFVVLYIKNENESKRIDMIYSSKTNSWKTIEQHGSIRLCYWVGEFVRGRIHWLERDGYVETFDLNSEVFGRIGLPCKQSVGDRVWLRSKMGMGRLWVVHDDNDKATRKVWEMKKDGEKESWVEVCGGPIPRSSESTHCVCTVEGGVVKFSPRNNIVDCHQFYFYIESLVPPVSDNNA